MNSGPADAPTNAKAPNIQVSAAVDSGPENSTCNSPSKLSASGISTWAKNLKLPHPLVVTQDDPSGNTEKSTFTYFTSGLGLRSSPKSPSAEDIPDGASTPSQSGFIGTLTKGFVDSSKSAVKAVQVVSQNKRRYQDNYLEEAMKMRNLLEEFRGNHGL